MGGKYSEIQLSKHFGDVNTGFGKEMWNDAIIWQMRFTGTIGTCML